MKTRIIKSSLVLFTMLILGACATIEGVGKDIEKAGEKIQEAAEQKE